MGDITGERKCESENRKRGVICKETSSMNSLPRAPNEGHVGAAGPAVPKPGEGAPAQEAKSGPGGHSCIFPAEKPYYFYRIMQTWWTRNALPTFGSRTTWLPFHAGDAEVGAGPLPNLFLVRQSSRELFQTPTPRFLQHRTTIASSHPPRESRKVTSEDLIVLWEAKKWSSQPLSLTGLPPGSSPPLPPTTGLPTNAQAHFLPSAPRLGRLSCLA